MAGEPEWYRRWLAAHEEMAICFRERRFEDAAQLMENARRRALENNSFEEAASYSGLLSSCLAILKRDQDALAASQEAERLAPAEAHYAVRSADLLVHYLKNPEAASEKLRGLLLRLASDDPDRYPALSLLGQVQLARGESDAAVALFREITSPETMARLQQAEYAGVYDLGLVRILIQYGLVPDECREYLAEVRRAAEANGSAHLLEDLERLIEQIPSPAD